MINGSVGKSALFLFLAALLGGCQIGGSTVSEREGYFTWVDEQGRVRYSPIARAGSRDSDSDASEQLDPEVKAEPERSGNPASSESGLEEETEYTLETTLMLPSLRRTATLTRGEAALFHLARC